MPKMSIKGFIKGASKSVSATAFIAAHRDFLLSGELAPVTSKIIERFDAGEVFPTPALKELQKVVYDHMLAADISKANKSIKRKSEEKLNDFVGYVYDKSGFIEKDDKGDDLIKGFSAPEDANAWVLRRLAALPTCYGVVEHSKLINKETGNPMQFRLERSEAMAEVLKIKPRTFNKVPTTGSLKFGVKVKESRCTFSHG